MRSFRRIVSIGVGLIQVLIGMVVAVVSIESIGLVTGDDFELNWPVAVLGLVVLGTVGLVVALVAGRSDALVVGALTTVVALIAGDLLLGVLVFAVVQLAPAVLPAHDR